MKRAARALPTDRARGRARINARARTHSRSVLFRRSPHPRSSMASLDPEHDSIGDSPPPTNLAGPGEIPRRQFGTKDVVVSAMALGGHAFAQAKTKRESIQIVHEAIDNGITFMDNAWDYHEGRSESLM